MLVLTIITGLYGLHFAQIALRGLLKKDSRIPHSGTLHRFAALIPARNEAQVIGFLVDSLMKQRYPSDLYDVYVIVNNCTDDTRAVAEAAGAKIIGCDVPVRSKGEVLRFTFKKLLAKGAPKYDAFLIFDADNLVDGGFLQAANDALSAGYEVAQGYRDSKNPSDNWVSGCTSTFFWFMSRLYNQSRANISMTANLNGTGIMMSADLIRKQGFDTTTLTEDLEYTAICILNGYKVGWMRDAIIYDEQPTTLMDSFIQRRRWGAGSLQCAKKYLKPLLTLAFKGKNRDAFDLALLFIGMHVQFVSILPSVISVIIVTLSIFRDPSAGIRQAIWLASSALVGGVFLGAGYAFIIATLEKKLTKIGLGTYCLMWLYMLAWIPANLSSLVLKAPKWKAIAHVAAVDIDVCEENAEKTPSGEPAVLRSKGTGI